MRKTKVLLASRPKILLEVIRFLVDSQPDMIVVSEVRDPLELFLLVRTSGAEVVIVTPLPGNGAPHICIQLLAEYPLLIIVTMTDKGDFAYLYKNGIAKQSIKNPTPQSVLDSIRSAVHPGNNK